MRAWIVFGAVIAVGCGPVADERTLLIEGDFDSVRVELSNGDLTVEEISGDQVRLEVDFGGVARRNTVGRYVEDDVLVLDYDCAFCGGDLVLGVPEHMPVDARLDHGELELDGLSGRVSAEVHAGSVTGENLACDTRVFNHAGSIELEWDFRPIAVDLEAHLGAVEVEVPAGGYRLDTRSNLGVVRLVDVFDDPDADGSITAYAHAGEVEIEGN